MTGPGHTITAVDPAGGHFLGAVVKNAGSTAHVTDLTVTASGLANVCDDGADRLRGILFDSASGSITDNTVDGINQGTSGCQEGNAIEVRKAPFDGTHPDTKAVTITHNVVRDFQKTGIVANGDVNATIGHNTVIGLGPVNFIAQNGIQIGFGGLGTVEHNKVSASVFTPQTFGSGGVLLFAAGDGLDVEHNEVDATDIGIWAAGADAATVSYNKVTNSTFDGIALDDQGGTVDDNTVAHNQSEDNDVGIGLYGANDNLIENNEAEGNASAGFSVGSGATGNTLSQNHAEENNGDGILVEADDNVIERNHSNENGGIGIAIDGDGNTIERNHAKENGVSDIQNTGNNTYAKNKCDSSSGPPVDCGASPSFTHEEIIPPVEVQPFE